MATECNVVAKRTPLLPAPANDDNPDAAKVDCQTESEASPGSLSQIGWIVAAVSCGIFLSAADKTIIVVSYAKIGSDLNALNLTSWIVTSYYLTLTFFEPLYGRLSDMLGRRLCLLFAYVTFGVGSLICGLAKDINQLIAGRVIQGFGGGGMATIVSIIMSDLVPLRDRGVWHGIINIVYASGAAFGAPLGGVTAEYIDWRWAFLGQASICLLAFIAVYILLKLPEKETGNWRANLRRVDILGELILVGAVTSFLIAMDRGSNISWNLPITIACLNVSVALFITFLLVEAYISIEPLAPRHIIFNRSLFAFFACSFFGFGGWLSLLYYVPLYFQAAEGLSVTAASLRLIPSTVCGVSGSLLGGWFVRRTGKYHWITVFAYCQLLTGLVVVSLASGTISTNSWLIVYGISLSAFGNGMGVTTSLVGLLSNADSQDKAMVTACSYLFRSLGSVLGLCLSSTVIQHSLRYHLIDVLPGNANKDIIEGVRESLGNIETLDLRMQSVVRHWYGWSIHLGFSFMTIIAALALVSSLCMKERKLTS